MNTVQAKEKRECCGCGVCAYICPVSAIDMKEDEFGFLYPIVDNKKCIHCGKCLKQCHFNNVSLGREFVLSYATRDSRTEVCEQSTSGGMFTSISDLFLQNGCVIYATGFSDGMKLEHRKIDDCEVRDQVRGSKYVQSDTSRIWEPMVEDLKAGLSVCFFGTPCQVDAALNLVPEKLKDKLYTVDIVCNGVGSPLIWSAFVREIEDQTGKTVVGYNFRPKTRGYLTPSEIVSFSDGTSKEEFNALRKFSSIYYSNLIMRPSCGNCMYCSFKRVSDLTIGDCSHLDKKDLPFDVKCGLSTVLINTEKGKSVFGKIAETVFLKEISKDECSQIRLREHITIPSESESFIDKCINNGVHRSNSRRFNMIQKIRFQLSAFLKAVKI